MDSFTFFAPGHRAAASDDGACSEAEQALISKFDLLSTVLENVSQGVVMFDSSRRLLVWNDQYQQILQFPDGFLQVGLSNWEMALHVAERGDYGEGDPEKLTAERLDLLWSGSETRSEITILDENIYDVLFRRTDDGGLVITYTDITERKRAEETIKRERDRTAEFLEIAEALIVALDPAGTVTLINRRAREVLGYAEDEIVGRNWFETVIPEDIMKEVRAIHAKMAAGEVEPVEYFENVVLTKAGERRFIAWHNTVARDDDGAITGSLSSGQDITERKWAEEALHESEQRLRLLTDALPALISYVDSQEYYRLNNTAYECWFGHPREQICGRHVKDVIGEATYDAIKPHIDTALSGEAVTYEALLPYKDGGHRFVRASYVPHVVEGGQVYGFFVLVEDLTEHKRAEDALKESEERFRAVIDSLPSLIFFKDTEGRYLFANKAFEKRVGLKFEEMAGKTFQEVLFSTEEGSREHLAVEREVRETREVIEKELPITRPDGTIGTGLVVRFPVFGAGGDLIAVGCSINTDITERKRAEEQLRQSQKLEAVGQLTGGVAHDFNNLLAVILGNLEFAKEELEADSSLHLLLDPALRATKRGGELTQRLLSFSRQQMLRPQTVDLNACVTGMTNMLRRTLGETIEIEPIIASGLWTSEIDPGQLESALLNLAVNARDAMPKGGRLTIETANIELDHDYAAAQGDVTPGHYVRLSVTDTGTGIPSENIEHVFEPFFTTKEVGEGSGLGLSMVFGFAKQSGGHVTISSEPGCGTTVQLYLPQAEAPAQPTGQESAMGDPEAQGETILVVEDDPDVRSLVISLLQRFGYNVLEAGDATEALAALQTTSRIDLLLSDVVLPGGVSGPDLAEQATDRYPGIKVLLMSGYPDAPHRRGPLVENAELLAKPFGKRKLAQKVRDVLSG